MESNNDFGIDGYFDTNNNWISLNINEIKQQ